MTIQQICSLFISCGTHKENLFWSNDVLALVLISFILINCIVLFSELYFKGELDIGQTLLEFKGLSVFSIVL